MLMATRLANDRKRKTVKDMRIRAWRQIELTNNRGWQLAYCWQKSKDHSANLSAAERAKRLSQMRRRAKKTLMRETVKRRVGRVRKMRLKARKWREEEETEEEWVIRKYKMWCGTRKIIAEESEDKT